MLRPRFCVFGQRLTGVMLCSRCILSGALDVAFVPLLMVVTLITYRRSACFLHYKVTFPPLQLVTKGDTLRLHKALCSFTHYFKYWYFLPELIITVISAEW